MQLASAYFIYFLIAVAIVHWLMPRAARVWVLLIASYVFYATWSRWGLAFLAGQTLATYVAGRMIVRSSRRGWLLIGLLPTLGMLLFVKYSNFAIDTISAAGAPWHLNSIN